MIIPAKAFAALCYLVLMDHHGEGYDEAHPVYIEDQTVLLERGYAAFASLDAFNQGKVLGHIIKWSYEVPDDIKTYVNKVYGANYFSLNGN